MRDIAGVELGARDYVINSYLDGKPAVAIAIFQRPGTNAFPPVRAHDWVATIISAFNSLTLSPALGAILLKPKDEVPSGFFAKAWDKLLGPLFRGFNKGFDKTSHGYANLVCRVARRPAISLIVFACLIGLTVFMFQRVPGGFIPEQDQGYVIIAVELPKGASLERTDSVVRQATDIALKNPGGLSRGRLRRLFGRNLSNASNAAASGARARAGQ